MCKVSCVPLVFPIPPGFLPYGGGGGGGLKVESDKHGGGIPERGAEEAREEAQSAERRSQKGLLPAV